MNTIYVFLLQAVDGVRFTWTITFGNAITCIGIVVTIIKLWHTQAQAKKAQAASVAAEAAATRDLEWRIANLETWRKEHMIDSDAKDDLIKNMGEILSKLKWVDEARQRQRNAPIGKRRLGDL